MHVSVIRCPMAAHDACALPTLVLRVHVGVSARTRVRVSVRRSPTPTMGPL